MNTSCFNHYRRVRPASRQLPTMIILISLLSLLPIASVLTNAPARVSDTTIQSDPARQQASLVDEVNDVGWPPFSGTNGVAQTVLPLEVAEVGWPPFSGTNTNGTNGVAQTVLPLEVAEVGWPPFSGTTITNQHINSTLLMSSQA